jgi:hypothetical protein
MKIVTGPPGPQGPPLGNLIIPILIAFVLVTVFVCCCGCVFTKPTDSVNKLAQYCNIGNQTACIELLAKLRTASANSGNDVQ